MFNSLNQGISTTKGILVVVLVAVIAGGGILAYQYLWQSEPETPPVQPPTDETANWLTYKNEYYGYEIKYPQDWGVDETVQEAVALFEFGQSPVYVSIYSNPQQISVDQWIEDKEKTDYWHVKNKDQISIGGLEGIKLIHENGVSFIEVFVSREKLIYEISIASGSSDISIFNKMLSTFEFIERQSESTKVLSPNGGETWVVGNTYDITWEKPGVDEVKVVLYRNDKFFDSIIISSINKVAYTVSHKDPTELPGDKYKVRVCKFIELGNADCDVEAGETLIMDDSDNYFSIVSASAPSISLISPNGGQVLEVGDNYEIKWQIKDWSQEDKIAGLFIDLVKYADPDCKNLEKRYVFADSTNPADPTKGSYQLTLNTDKIGQLITPGVCYKIELVNVRGASSAIPPGVVKIFDQSDNYFSIVEK